MEIWNFNDINYPTIDRYIEKQLFGLSKQFS